MITRFKLYEELVEGKIPRVGDYVLYIGDIGDNELDYFLSANIGQVIKRSNISTYNDPSYIVCDVKYYNIPQFLETDFKPILKLGKKIYYTIKLTASCLASSDDKKELELYLNNYILSRDIDKYNL